MSPTSPDQNPPCVPAAGPDTCLARLWNWLCRHPLLTIIFFLAVQTVPSLWSGELWLPDEVRHASILQNMLRSGSWLQLELGGTPYVDKPPLYFWFQGAVVRLLGTDRPPVFFLTVAVSGLFFLYSTYLMARRVGGMSREGGLLCTLLLLSNFFFIECCHSPRMDLMFYGFMNCGVICLFLAWSRTGFRPLTVAGFALLAVATLIKGPLAVLFPVLGGVVWLCWQRRARRLLNWDVALGLVVAQCMVGAWLWSWYQTTGPVVMKEIFLDQLVKRAVDSPNLREPFLYFFWMLPLKWMPWTLLLLCLPLRQMTGRPFWVRWWAGRSSVESGPLLLWCLTLGVFIVLTCMSYKRNNYLLALFAPCIVLTGRGLGRLGAAFLRRLAVALAVIYFLVALVMPVVKFFYDQPEHTKGLLWVGALLALMALALVRFRNRPAGQIVLLAAIGMTLVTQPIYMITRPGQDAVTSPKIICTELRRQVDQGFVPVAFGLDDYKAYRTGSLDYYVGLPLPDLARDEGKLRRHLSEHPRVVLLTTGRFWDNWTNRPASLQKVFSQHVDWTIWILAVQDGPVPVR